MTAPINHRSHLALRPNDVVSQMSPRVPTHASHHEMQDVHGIQGEDPRPEHPRATLVLALGIISLTFPLIAPAVMIFAWWCRRATGTDKPYRRDQKVGLGFIFSLVSTVGTVLFAMILFGTVLMGIVGGWISYLINI